MYEPRKIQRYSNGTAAIAMQRGAKLSRLHKRSTPQTQRPFRQPTLSISASTLLMIIAVDGVAFTLLGFWLASRLFH